MSPTACAAHIDNFPIMASVTSQNPSTHGSPYGFESTDDSDESWQYIDYSSGASAAASVGFMPSPASGSLSGFAIVGHVSTPSQTGMSPLHFGDVDQPVFLPSSSAYTARSEPVVSDMFAGSADEGFPPTEAFLTPQQYLFSHQQTNQTPPQGFGTDLVLGTSLAGLVDTDIAESGKSSFNSFQVDPFTSLHTEPQNQRLNFSTATSFQSDPNVPSWNPASSRAIGENIISFEEFIPSPTDDSNDSPSPGSSAVKTERKSPTAIRRIKVGKVEKRKSESAGKFVIVTPTSISAHAGKPNPFECFEAMRTTQRGRKGPLANETKENALQVRRLGACFCCHSRKVKCDKERPCKHCKKLMIQVPQVVCWQFQDFLTVLFPEFIRGHFKKDEMSKFMNDNIDSFTVNGVDQPCHVELFSGSSFSATLSVDAKFFAAKTCDVLQHWHMSAGKDQVSLYSNGSAPIGLEFTSNSQRDDLRKRAKVYIQDITKEPTYSEQLSASFRSTQLPKKVLKIAQTYAQQTDSSMVKRALSIYAMHYVMSRHLCLTRQTIMNLQPTGLVPQNIPWVTPRVLARQIKSLIDELIMREMQQLFDLFSKSLKPKAKREWAPCLVSFLVLCLYMEAVEMTADNFVISQNEINLRNSYPPEYQRAFALRICKEVENMPFKQFAYQFHNIYQTHTRDANTKSFNPLFDDSFREQGELDGPAIQMVESLRELFHGEDWQDLQFLGDDAILLNREEHPFPVDTSVLYTGRLIAKFLLSFMNENAIFGSQI
ncbi:hypothetical protein HJFPF1_02769 [Paramyrothecium foliicola]|nr:hypothetical protein HJFPF1_02769 [Paramyrothecium foliicola]